MPAFLEEENLRILLPRLRQALRQTGESFEMLVVDTPHPLDNTAAVCAQYGASCFPRNGGDKYGDAVRTGIRRARGSWILVMDADGSHPPEFISRLLSERPNHDVIIASRYVNGGFSENTLLQRLMSLVLNLSYSWILGLPCKDVSNSFKLYRGSFLRSLSLRCENFDIVEEILFKLKRFNPQLSIMEVPFIFKKRMFGQTKRNLPLFILTYIYTMIRLRFIQ